MTGPAIFAPAARHDLRQAVTWIAQDNPAAAEALSIAAGRAARRIGTHPHIGATRAVMGSNRYRFLGLRGFPYLLIYTAETTPPRILRILHMARDLPPLLAELGP